MSPLVRDFFFTTLKRKKGLAAFIASLPKRFRKRGIRRIVIFVALMSIGTILQGGQLPTIPG